MDERPTRRFANYLSSGRVPTLGTIPFHRKPALILLFEYHHAAPTSAHVYGAHEYGWRLETSHDDMLLVREVIVQAARGRPTIVWNDWALMHAEGHKLHNLRRSNLHCTSPGMYLCENSCFLFLQC